MVVLVVVAALCRAGARTASKRGPAQHFAERSATDREFSFRVRRLLSAATADELDRLATDSDGYTALAAAWECVCRTLPANEQDEEVPPDEQTTSLFLKLVTERIEVPVPDIWRAAVKDVKGAAKDLSLPSPQRKGQGVG